MGISQYEKNTVVGVFSHLDGVLDAIGKVKGSEFKKSFQVYSPVPNHDIEHALHEPRSGVRWFAFFGTSFGAIGGFSFAMYTSWYWSVYLGGKPPMSFQPYVIVGFEMFILFGALFTLVGAILLTKVFWRLDAPGYDERFSQDKFGVCVQCDAAKIATVEKLLKDSGAAEVRVEKEEVYA